MPSTSVPRNFKLLDELERGERGLCKGNGRISYGLVDPEDMSMSDWSCTIFGPLSVFISPNLSNRL